MFNLNFLLQVSALFDRNYYLFSFARFSGRDAATA